MPRTASRTNRLITDHGRRGRRVLGLVRVTTALAESEVHRQQEGNVEAGHHERRHVEHGEEVQVEMTVEVPAKVDDLRLKGNTVI